MALAALAVLAAGCGTVTAQAAGVASAVASTAGRSARVSLTTTMRMPGMSVSFTETGAFDFAHSRGVLRMRGRQGMANEMLFVPPKMYMKLASRPQGPLPHGKSWIAIPADSGGLVDSLLGPFGSTDPANLLSSLTAISSSVTKLQGGVIRGVRAALYRVIVDPAKAASRVPRWKRAGFLAFARSLGTRIPVDVWVDQQDLVRQVRISAHTPGGSGGPAGSHVIETLDFYDFGVPVRVSAPPAAEVASISQLSRGGPSFSSGLPGGASRRPPRASGRLSPAQATAAEQAVRAFWSALGGGARAVAETVLPTQRACVRSITGGPRITVTSLRIMSAQPAGPTMATVRFTMKAQVRLGGHSLPVLPQGPRHVQWLVTTLTGGHWYVNFSRSSFPFGPFGSACR